MIEKYYLMEDELDGVVYTEYQYEELIKEQGLDKVEANTYGKYEIDTEELESCETLDELNRYIRTALKTEETIFDNLELALENSSWAYFIARDWYLNVEFEYDGTKNKDDEYLIYNATCELI